jgi:hypothetical protein
MNMLHERAMCVDALPAVKEIVHEKKEVSLAELGASCIPERNRHPRVVHRQFGDWHT